ncbi:carboxylesterase family protein [Pseudomonas duriflava]|uniref:Carboxylesterase family protein n=1 Tax=Pseudomonas duriflava TaxID=459528 RepID=A0A562Q752_9PSED|nr:carboxylesterase family protein [Pseudomonas duriflava]TWI52563.1 carboxylesterase family protein [Pseudomonas duriflava]
MLLTSLAIPADLILEKGPDYMPVAQVVVDGQIIPTTFKQAFTSGQFNQVPVINGFNSNEGTFFAGFAELMMGRKMTMDDYKPVLQAFLGSERGAKLFGIAQQTVLQQPPPENVGENYASFFGRAKFICPVPISSAMLGKFVPVYTYEFADPTAPQLLKPAFFPYLASHTAELQYLFKGFHGVTGNQGALSGVQQSLSSQMINHWTNFAKTGVPGGANTPA